MSRVGVILRATVALVLAASVQAGARSLAIPRFDATIGVAADGSINVEERIVFQFTGAWNGIFRTIPVDYRTPQGLRYSLRLSIDSIKDEAGNNLKYEVSRERNYRKVKIWVPGAEDATHTISIHYRVANALRFFDEHDELYWNVTGDEWDVPIQAASATILLPEGVTGLRAAAFRGAFGSTLRNEVAIAPHMVRVTNPGLGFREGLTAVVGWNPGIVHRPTALEKAVETVRSNWPLAVPLVAFVCMGGLWFFKGKDPKPGPITTLYEPPQDMSPGEAGALLDDSVDMRDITATIVDLAVRGFIRIEELRDGSSAVSGYRFASLRPHTDWDALKKHERLLLDGLFAIGDRVSTSNLRNAFYKHLGGIRSAISSANEKHYDSGPGLLSALAVLGGMFMFAAPIVWWLASLFLRSLVGSPGIATVVSGVITGAIVFGFGVVLPRRSSAGTRELEKVLGFQEFLSRVDGDRLERIVQTPDMFEKYLPYAMALKVESEWGNAFREIYTQPPEWYGGTANEPFNAGVFSGRLERMSSDLDSVFTSTPRAVRSSDSSDRSWSSGGSGFSGGSSGGGFGGGGGGGF
jgi:uncharacterized membrane protein YgcG